MPTVPTQNQELSHSPDAQAQRQQELLALIRQTAPEVISDNQIDIERLKELLGQERIAPAEHYELSWAGKSAARREIQKTTSHTLLPFANNPAQAPHMLIEGENLEVLRVLQKSYYGKVKMIYIDPPYNTGNDSFVYPDDYSETLDEYLKRTGEKSEAGFLNKQSLWKKNTKESGQYHSAWLSMMYPRLYLARNLLRDDGVIFISIDDNEQANLKNVCDGIFGEENYISLLSVEINPKGRKNSQFISVSNDFCLIYAKNKAKSYFIENIPKSATDMQEDEDGNFVHKSGKRVIVGSNGFNAVVSDFASEKHYSFYLNKSSKKFEVRVEQSVNEVDENLINNGYKRYVSVVDDVFIENTYTKRKIGELFEDGALEFKEDKIFEKNFNDVIRMKSVVVNRKYEALLQGKPQEFLIDVKTTSAGTDLKNLFETKDVLFTAPKNFNFIKLLLTLLDDSNFIVLDFFAGSGTTAQAVMELNLEDGGNRQCICVQMPEVLDESSEAYKAGYRTIADITRARIDKVIAKLKSEHPEKTSDLACANFTLAPSNFKTWRTDVADVSALREQLGLFQSAEKNTTSSQTSDTQIAMLTELLLKHGLGALSVHAISKPKTLAGVTIHRVLMKDDKILWLCFEPYTEALKNEIVSANPAQVILLNSCFVGDKADELLSNLQLELTGLDIGLLVI